jgi:hypothetical protein
MGKEKGKGTPDELDYLFERDIIDEEDYVYFWRNYWRRGESGRQSLINEFLERANELDSEEQGELSLAGVVTKNKADAIRQAKSIGGRVVRRNKRGQFSKRGRSYQAIRHGKKKK